MRSLSNYSDIQNGFVLESSGNKNPKTKTVQEAIKKALSNIDVVDKPEAAKAAIADVIKGLGGNPKKTDIDVWYDDYVDNYVTESNDGGEEDGDDKNKGGKDGDDKGDSQKEGGDSDGEDGKEVNESKEEIEDSEGDGDSEEEEEEEEDEAGVEAVDERFGTGAIAPDDVVFLKSKGVRLDVDFEIKNSKLVTKSREKALNIADTLGERCSVGVSEISPTEFELYISESLGNDDGFSRLAYDVMKTFNANGFPDTRVCEYIPENAFDHKADIDLDNSAISQNDCVYYMVGKGSVVYAFEHNMNTPNLLKQIGWFRSDKPSSMVYQPSAQIPMPDIFNRTKEHYALSFEGDDTGIVNETLTHGGEFVRFVSYHNEDEAANKKIKHVCESLGLQYRVDTIGTETTFIVECLTGKKAEALEKLENGGGIYVLS